MIGQSVRQLQRVRLVRTSGALLAGRGLARGVEVELGAGGALVDVEDVDARRLEVRGGVVGRGDKDARLGAVVGGDEKVLHSNKLLEDRADGLVGNLELVLGRG